MPARYKPYPEYKESGLKWLGTIPVNWSLRKAKYLFKRVQRSVRPDDGIVTAFRDGQVTLRSNRREEGFTNSIQEIGYQGVRKGDLLIHSMDGFAGAIGVSDSDGKCSPVCSVCMPLFSNQILIRYYGYLIRQLAITDFITSLAKGIRERSTEFRYSEFSALELVVPPLREQIVITNFLDHETGKIDALIEKQQQLIKLLQEKRQAVISHAVTKGLNPAAPMKDSGIDWLGQVPEDWVIAKVSFRYEILLGKMLDSKKIDGKYLGAYLRNTDVQWDCINSEDLPEMDFYPDEQERYSVRKGDLLVCEGGEIGRCAIWKKEENCFYQKALHRLRPLEEGKDFPRFMFYLMFDAVARERFISEAGKATIAHLPAESFRQYRFAFPSLAEQKIIVNYLDAQKQKFDLLESKARSQIELLQERRTALISAAVTGKIDVRDWRAPAGSTVIPAEAGIHQA